MRRVTCTFSTSTEMVIVTAIWIFIGAMVLLFIRGAGHETRR